MDCKREMKLSLSSLEKSPKHNGVYEDRIIDRLGKYFKEKNYCVKKHISFNIAWGKVLSEIDLILLKDNEITIIEVKSKKDDINKSYDQIQRFKKYADYIYVASEVILKKSEFCDFVGLIYVNKNIIFIRHPLRINNVIKKRNLEKLKKKCLRKLLNHHNKLYSGLTKKELVDLIFQSYKKNVIYDKFKQIIFCNRNCEKCKLTAGS